MGLMSRVIKKLADDKKLPIQQVKKMATGGSEEKELPVQQTATQPENQAQNDVENLSEEEIKRRQLRNSAENLSEEEMQRRQLRNQLAANSGAGSTLLG